MESLGRCGDGVQDQVHRLLRCSFISYDAIVIEVPDHGQVQYALLGMNVGDVRDPFAVGPVRMELPVQKILVFVYLLSHLLPLPPAANLRQQIIFLHDPQYGFGIAEKYSGFSATATSAGSRKCGSCVPAAMR